MYSEHHLIPQILKQPHRQGFINGKGRSNAKSDRDQQPDQEYYRGNRAAKGILEL